MKWIGFLFLLVLVIGLVLIVWGLSDNASDIAHAKSMVESAWAVQVSPIAAQIAPQGMSDICLNFTLILILLTIILTLLAGLAVYITIYRLFRWSYKLRPDITRKWAADPNAQ